MTYKYINLQPRHTKAQYIPPFRYGIVEHGVFRGAYPKQNNFSFLKKLKLKRILSLTPEPLNEAAAKFCAEEGIEMLHIKVEKPKDTIPLTPLIVFQALQVLISGKYPVYIHCLDGAIVTGVVIMCLRKFQLWSAQVAMAEFSRHTRDGVISAEETEFLEKFGAPNNPIIVPVTITLLANDETGVSDQFVVNASDQVASNTHELDLPQIIPKWLWNGSIPSSFLRGLAFNHNIPYNSHLINCTLTYGHPFIRVRITGSQISTLLSYDKQSVISLFPTNYAGHGKSLLSFVATTTSSQRSGSISKEGPSAVDGLKNIEASGQQVVIPAEGIMNKKKAESASESDISLTLKALALEGI